jgi:DNA-binding response OmpR family regulator
MTKGLIVDDIEEIRDFIGKVMKREGYDYDVAENGRDALEKLTVNKYDFVVLDVVMPEMDGLQMIMEMNKLMEEDERPPIIGISGGGERMPGWYAVQMVEMLGGRSVLSKPFSVEELRTAISEALGKSA